MNAVVQEQLDRVDLTMEQAQHLVACTRGEQWSSNRRSLVSKLRREGTLKGAYLEKLDAKSWDLVLVGVGWALTDSAVHAWLEKSKRCFSFSAGEIQIEPLASR